MGRATKFLAAAIAAVAFSGVLAAGAVGPTSTTPVTLCIAKGGVVRVPTSSTPCVPSKETTFQAASYSEFAALVARMDAAETTLGGKANQTDLATLQGQVTTLAASLAGKADQDDLGSLADDIADLSEQLALLTRIPTLEGTLAGTCQPGVVCESLRVVGTNLQPGTKVEATFVVPWDTTLREILRFTVPESGDVDLELTPTYAVHVDHWTLTGVGRYGAALTGTEG